MPRIRVFLVYCLLVVTPGWAGIPATRPVDYPQIRATYLSGDAEYMILNKGSRIIGERTRGGRWLYATGEFFYHGDYGDIDGDRRLDVVTDQGIFLGHGDGQFGIHTVKFVGHPGGIACGDLNGDGRDDVVLGTLGVRAYLSRPDATLEFYKNLDLPFEGGYFLRLVDLDADGDLDLYGGSVGGPLLAYNLGDATFRKWPKPPRFPQTATLCDLNRDGLTDFVTVGYTASWQLGYYGAVFVYLGAGKEALGDELVLRIPGLTSQEDPSGRGVAVADVDRDGHDDIVCGGRLGILHVFRGKGDGMFERTTRAISVPLSERINALVAEDLDLDGHRDLLVQYGSQTSCVYWGVPGGFVNFENPTVFLTPEFIRFELIWGVHRAFIRGDADDDWRVTVTDAVAIVEQLFCGRETLCGDASDVDDSGLVNILDAVFLLRHLFSSGPPPPYPYPDPGGDATRDQIIGPASIPGDLGCSRETFRFRDFSACGPANDGSMEHCRNPIRQFLDPSTDF